MNRLFLLGVCVCPIIGYAVEEQVASPFVGEEGKEVEEEELIVFNEEELEEDDDVF